ncbi:hypothetical protein G8C93_06010 [Cellulosimicrobium cellulans]|uniref:hypothetical protein n=1 Tax=Cellulosimicrobium cellulans TaxID=1710 RepID=UPI0018833CCB|nr:hypothetical protein [Cellulosimicrobium cellulans]MBE9925445.1 hypothetical protein [Cellulosimicrobium cellulans]
MQRAQDGRTRVRVTRLGVAALAVAVTLGVSGCGLVQSCEERNAAILETAAGAVESSGAPLALLAAHDACGDSDPTMVRMRYEVPAGAGDAVSDALAAAGWGRSSQEEGVWIVEEHGVRVFVEQVSSVEVVVSAHSLTES